MTNIVITVFVCRKGVSVEGYQSKVMDDNNIGQVYRNVQREMWEWLPPVVPPAGIVDITIYYRPGLQHEFMSEWGVHNNERV